MATFKRYFDIHERLLFLSGVLPELLKSTLFAKAYLLVIMVIASQTFSKFNIFTIKKVDVRHKTSCLLFYLRIFI